MSPDLGSLAPVRPSIAEHPHVRKDATVERSASDPSRSVSAAERRWRRRLEVDGQALRPRPVGVLHIAAAAYQTRCHSL